MRVLPATVRSVLAVAAATLVIGSEAPTAQARDFFSSFFNAESGQPSEPEQRALGYNGSGDSQFPPQMPRSGNSGRSTAYCVRTCDGRYFPVAANNEQSRAATCSSLCPASETKVFHGSAIENAKSDSGRSYSSLPNAFKYREQLVNGCTCNGKDSVGLAPIGIDQDKTIRRGDIVVGEGGLIVANRAIDKKRGSTADFTPAPQRIREKFERSQAVALR